MTNAPSLKMIILCAASTWLSLTPANAESDTENPAVAEKWSVLVTYGDDECPAATDGEIVVCAKRPESERYRIPKELRAVEEKGAADQSWTSTVGLHDEAARAERPNSCSAVGSNGFGGCQSAALRRWFAERRALED